MPETVRLFAGGTDVLGVSGVGADSFWTEEDEVRRKNGMEEGVIRMTEGPALAPGAAGATGVVLYVDRISDEAEGVGTAVGEATSLCSISDQGVCGLEMGSSDVSGGEASRLPIFMLRAEEKDHFLSRVRRGSGARDGNAGECEGAASCTSGITTGWAGATAEICRMDTKPLGSGGTGGTAACPGFSMVSTASLYADISLPPLALLLFSALPPAMIEFGVVAVVGIDSRDVGVPTKLVELDDSRLSVLSISSPA